MATERGYVHAEIKYVLDMADEQPEGTLFIVPVRLEECEVPERLASFQWLDLFREDGYERLRRALEAMGTKRVVPQSSEGAAEPTKEAPPAEATHPSGVRVMLSYSHRDSRFREQLDKHLALLKRQRLITVWHDRELTAGRDFDRGIAKELAAADIILLLISADFMASDYCYTKEMATALERHVAGTARVIPIILREVDWQHGPFANLVALPLDGRPVTSWGRREDPVLRSGLVSGWTHSSTNLAISRRRTSNSRRFGEPPHSHWGAPIPSNTSLDVSYRADAGAASLLVDRPFAPSA